jgi:hypothetical protein
VLYVMLFDEGGNCVLYLNVRTVYIMTKQHILDLTY